MKTSESESAGELPGTCTTGYYSKVTCLAEVIIEIIK